MSWPTLASRHEVRATEAGSARLPGGCTLPLTGSDCRLLTGGASHPGLDYAERRLPGLFTRSSGTEELRTSQVATDCGLSGSPRSRGGDHRSRRRTARDAGRSRAYCGSRRDANSFRAANTHPQIRYEGAISLDLIQSISQPTRRFPSQSRPPEWVGLVPS